jgi:SAM-dependent methyltransferase
MMERREKKAPQAEFDALAENYHQQHKANVAVTGEEPEFFARYKVADLALLSGVLDGKLQSILDFGCGIGNSLPHFRRFFPEQYITCADVSARSIEMAASRFPGSEQYVLIKEKELLLDNASQDISFSACVFHHIPHSEHQHWLGELLRVTRPGGLLVIYEHNPFNPLTLRAVNTCPLDANAELIRAGVLKSRAESCGWQECRIDYRLFFPAAFSCLRPLERRLTWLPLGAQYCLVARRPA